MIIVYGGTFNPPTLAHEKIVELIISKYHPSDFIILPVGDNYTWKSEIMPFKYRYEMLEIAFGNENIKISTLENSKDYKGTYYSLKEIKGSSSNDVYFVLGADNLVYLNKWINYQDLLKEFKFIILTRDDFDVESIIDNYYKLYKNNFEVVNVKYDLSASEFRSNPSKYYKHINKDVLIYIKENNLYRGDKKWF